MTNSLAVIVAHKGFIFHYNMLLSEISRYQMQHCEESEMFEAKIAGIFESNNILLADSLEHMRQVSTDIM